MPSARPNRIARPAKASSSPRRGGPRPAPRTSAKSVASAARAKPARRAKRARAAKPATPARAKGTKSPAPLLDRSLFAFAPTFNTAYAKRHNRRAA